MTKNEQPPIKKESRISELHHVTVFRGKGKYIQTIHTFTDFAEAVDFAKETPADQQWSMTLSLVTTRVFTEFTNEAADITLKVKGPGYTAHLYD